MCTIKVEETVYVYPGITRHYELRWLDRVDGRAQLVTASYNSDGTLGDVRESVEFYSLIGATQADVWAEMLEQMTNANVKPHLTERDAALPCTCVLVAAA